MLYKRIYFYLKGSVYSTRDRVFSNSNLFSNEPVRYSVVGISFIEILHDYTF